jgi:hypothetical protein
MLPHEAKFSKVPTPPTMLTMEGFQFWVIFGLCLLLTRFLLTRFLLTWFLSLVPKELIPQDTLLEGKLRLFLEGKKFG